MAFRLSPGGDSLLGNEGEKAVLAERTAESGKNLAYLRRKKK